MPVSKKLNVIFIHIPKNAGESVERTLGMYGGAPDEMMWGIDHKGIALQHLTASQLRLRLNDAKTWDNYFKFAIVRNPWSKAVSEYNWYLRYGPTVPFFEWVESLPYRIKANTTIHENENGHNIHQHKFIFNDDAELMVDKVLYFEDIGNQFSDLSNRMGWKAKLCHSETTKSPSKIPFQKYYDTTSMEIIESLYSRDIELFGYNKLETFEGYVLTDKRIAIDEFFDPDRYLSLHPDVKASGIEPREHYFTYGIKEGRRVV